MVRAKKGKVEKLDSAWHVHIYIIHLYVNISTCTPGSFESPPTPCNRPG